MEERRQLDFRACELGVLDVQHELGLPALHEPERSAGSRERAVSTLARPGLEAERWGSVSPCDSPERDHQEQAGHEPGTPRPPCDDLQ
jgi:hypothetical protein